MYSGLFYGGLILSIIFLVASVVLFFVLKIPKVFGDLTGRTQKKAIEDIQKTGYETKSKKDAIHDQTSRITVRDAASDTSTLNAEKVVKKERIPTRMFEDETEVLGHENYGKEDADQTEVLGAGEDSTDVLMSDGRSYSKPSSVKAESRDDDATDVLTSEEYDSDYGTTDVLTSGTDDDDYGTTDVLTSGTDDDDYGTTDVLTSGADEDEYGTTDVLTSPTAESEAETSILTGNGDSDEGETAVLTSDEKAPKHRDDVYGSDNEEETAVLKNPLEGTTANASRKLVEIYSVTEVHTTESL